MVIYQTSLFPFTFQYSVISKILIINIYVYIRAHSIDVELVILCLLPHYVLYGRIGAAHSK